MTRPADIPVFRFAPSPNGELHLGHAFSALFAYDHAKAAGGRFLLRIEDIDIGRCRPEFEEAIYRDLGWLGLDWETPVRRQSEHFGDYENALKTLQEMGVVYPCFCTRKNIAAEIAASHSAPHHTPDGTLLYPGTCRHLSPADRRERMWENIPYAVRLDVTKARALAEEKHDGPLCIVETGQGPYGEHGTLPIEPERFGDVVIARKDVPTSYHLSVTVDDAIQGVTHVTRGNDLFYASFIHRLLQELLDLPVPEWRHHAIVRDEEGNRLAKRDKPLSLRSLREAGASAAEIRAQLGFAR